MADKRIATRHHATFESIRHVDEHASCKWHCGGMDATGSTELAANLFRATQAEEKLRRDQVRGKTKANKALGAALLALATCTAQAQTALPLLAAFSTAKTEQPPAPWRVVGIPGGKLALSTFSITPQDGAPVLKLEANKSYGNLVHALAPDAVTARPRLGWRWRLDSPLAAADLRTRSGDDSALKVCLLFDMPLERLGLVERNLLRLARAVSGEILPAATLCYVWDDKLAAGTLLRNAYTARVRLIVAAGAGQPLAQWQTQSRDVAADFQKAFGEESDSLAPLTAVLVGADSDNSGGHSLGFIGDVVLTP